jgi:hypothetical protein
LPRRARAVEIDKALEERLRYVEENRARLLADASSDLEAARARVIEQVHKLPALRDELLAARETLTWVAAYPESPAPFGFQNALALGLREPVERTLQTKARVDFSSVLAVLEADAKALAETHGEDTRRQLGIAGPRTPLREALWDSDTDMIAWKKQGLERARQLAEFGNSSQLAAEID